MSISADLRRRREASRRMPRLSARDSRRDPLDMAHLSQASRLQPCDVHTIAVHGCPAAVGQMITDLGVCAVRAPEGTGWHIAGHDLARVQTTLEARGCTLTVLSR